MGQTTKDKTKQTLSLLAKIALLFWVWNILVGIFFAENLDLRDTFWGFLMFVWAYKAMDLVWKENQKC